MLIQLVLHTGPGLGGAGGAFPQIETGVHVDVIAGEMGKELRAMVELMPDTDLFAPLGAAAEEIGLGLGVDEREVTAVKLVEHHAHVATQFVADMILVQQFAIGANRLPPIARFQGGLGEIDVVGKRFVGKARQFEGLKDAGGFGVMADNMIAALYAILAFVFFDILVTAIS